MTPVVERCIGFRGVVMRARGNNEANQGNSGNRNYWGSGGIMTAPAVQALTITHTEEKIDLGAAPLPNTTTLGTTVNGAGTPIGVVVSGGAGGVLNIIDLKTRANIASYVLDDAARNAGEEVHAWDM